MELFDPAQGIQLHQFSATWSIIFLARTPQAFARASLPRCIVVQPVLLLPRLLLRRLPTQTQTPQAVRGASLHRRTSGTSERVPSKSKPAQLISLTEGSHATVWSAVANHAPQSCSAPHFFLQHDATHAQHFRSCESICTLAAFHTWTNVPHRATSSSRNTGEDCTATSAISARHSATELDQYSVPRPLLQCGTSVTNDSTHFHQAKRLHDGRRNPVRMVTLAIASSTFGQVLAWAKCSLQLPTFMRVTDNTDQQPLHCSHQNHQNKQTPKVTARNKPCLNLGFSARIGPRGLSHIIQFLIMRLAWRKNKPRETLHRLAHVDLLLV